MAPVVLAMPTAVMVVSVVLVVVPGSSMAAVVMVVSVAPRVSVAVMVVPVVLVASRVRWRWWVRAAPVVAVVRGRGSLP